MSSPSAQNCEEAESIVEVRHKAGLHMRPAMQFVDCANSFQAKITVTKDQLSVDGKSIMHLTMLAATYGTKLKIYAVGKDASQAIEALTNILEKGSLEDIE